MTEMQDMPADSSNPLNQSVLIGGDYSRLGAEVPPVHPYLVAYLKGKFPISLFDGDPRDPLYPQLQAAFHERAVGAQQVIAYLEELSNRPVNVQEIEHELSRSEAESAGPDPRRPGPRSGR